MTIVNSCFVAWVQFLGGVETIQYTLALIFVFMIIMILFKITI